MRVRAPCIFVLDARLACRPEILVPSDLLPSCPFISCPITDGLAGAIRLQQPDAHARAATLLAAQGRAHIPGAGRGRQPFAISS